MASKSSKVSPKDTPTNYPEFGVRREQISSYFHPPLAESTFYDFVKKGKIAPMKGIRGFYKLNDSLRRLGLREVPNMPEIAKRSMEDITRLALSLIDPLVFPSPPWLLTVEALDAKEVDHAMLLADQHRERIDAFGDTLEKIAYGAGILDGAAMRDAGTDSDKDDE